MKTKHWHLLFLIPFSFIFSQNQNTGIENYYSLRHQIVNDNKSWFKSLNNNTVLFSELTMIIKSVKDTTILWFFKNNNCVKDYPCYLKPYSDYCSKNKSKEKYCVSSHNIMQNLLIKNKVSDYPLAYSYIGSNPTSTNTLSSRNVSQNILNKNPKLPLTPENLQPLYALGYYYNYHNVRKTFKEFGKHACVSTNHECLIVDILYKDNHNGYYVLTFNYPNPYYSVIYINFDYRVIIIDPHLLYNIEKINTQNILSTKFFKSYVGSNLVNSIDKSYVFKINTIWNLYVLYEKMQVKDIYHKYAHARQ